MSRRTKVTVGAVGLVAAALAPCLVAVAPVSAAQAAPFNAAISGTLQVTGGNEFGPTSAVYGGQGLATMLGPSRMQGDITITGPAECPNGFAATHTDTLTGKNGSQLLVTVMETSCPRPSDPGTYDCTGTYTVTGGTGRYSTATGGGTWSGSLTFVSQYEGTFDTTYSGVLSGM